MTGFLRTVAAGGAVTLVSLIIVKSMAFLNSIIAARLLGPYDYGAYSVIFNLQNFASIIACCGIPLSLVKYVAQFRNLDKKIAEHLGSYLMTALLISSLVTSVAYLALADIIAVSLYDDSQLTMPIRLSSLFVFVSCINMALISTVQGCQQISKLARVNAIVAIMAQPLTYVMIWYFGLTGAIFSLIISATVSVILLLNITMKILPLSLTFKRPRLRAGEQSIMISFAIPSFLSSLLLVPAFWFGRTVLAINWGFDSVGEFQVAESLSQFMLMIPAAMSVPLLPLVSEMHAKDADRIGDSTGSLLRIVVLVILPIGIIAYPFLDGLVGTMYGSEYRNASTTIALMFCSSTIIAISTVMSTVIIGTGRMWLGLGMNLVWAALFFTCAMVFVPGEDSDGLAMTYVLSHGAYLAILLGYFNRRFSVHIFPLIIPVLGFLVYTSMQIREFNSYDLASNFGAAAMTAFVITIFTFALVLEPRERRLVVSISRRILGRSV